MKVYVEKFAKNKELYDDMKMSTREQYEKRKKSIQLHDLQQVHIQKKSSSNLFRYKQSEEKKQNPFSLKGFDHILEIDETAHTLEAEGLATYETIVKHTLPFGLMPTVTPELKQITIGGAIVGIGIESTCYKEGFVHDGLIEADVLLPSGQIVTCSATNEYSDLFYGLPNSYGTLGYLLRVKIKLVPVKPFVCIKSRRFTDITQFLSEMALATEQPEVDYIESLFYSKNEFYLLTTHQLDKVPFLDDIYKKSIFYKLCSEGRDIYLKIEDYIFRYDPDWFWHIPTLPCYKLLRFLCPKKWRNSGYYKKFLDFKIKIKNLFSSADKTDLLIQDWQVPWDQAEKIISFALENINLPDMPWLGLPIKPLHKATLYPMKNCPYYFNLGCYANTRSTKGQKFFSTKLIDEMCFQIGGLKMLYSSLFISKEQFDQIYNGSAYKLLKQKYDPKHCFKDLYQKCVYHK